jgi:hypothetical protein
VTHTFTPEEIRRGHATYRARGEARFWSRVDTSGGVFACWPWTGPRQTGGRYGIAAKVDYGHVIYAHRRALELALGRELLPGMVAMHSCDNPPCCNPLHLSEGTKADNAADMVAKGRAPRGRRPNPIVHPEIAA